MLKDWHLELTAAHYRRQRRGQEAARDPKMVYNIVLSMPAPTPPEKVLAASRKFARERFAGRHRYAMVLHTDQANPHVHMVVKAEDEQGRRLHVDKAMLRQWREDFARLIREQGVAANATPRVIRGRNNGRRNKIADAAQSGTRVPLQEPGRLPRAFTDRGHDEVRRTREFVSVFWRRTAEVLDAQGEIELAGDVRYFAKRLPVLSSGENHPHARPGQVLDARNSQTQNERESARHRDDELVR